MLAFLLHHYLFYLCVRGGGREGERERKDLQDWLKQKKLRCNYCIQTRFWIIINISLTQNPRFVQQERHARCVIWFSSQHSFMTVAWTRGEHVHFLECKEWTASVLTGGSVFDRFFVSAKLRLADLLKVKVLRTLMKSVCRQLTRKFDMQCILRYRKE